MLICAYQLCVKKDYHQMSAEQTSDSYWSFIISSFLVQQGAMMIDYKSSGPVETSL